MGLLFFHSRLSLFLSVRLVGLDWAGLGWRALLAGWLEMAAGLVRLVLLNEPSG